MPHTAAFPSIFFLLQRLAAAFVCGFDPASFAILPFRYLIPRFLRMLFSQIATA